ncbi:polysaccharide deacetylase family protein [Phaeodactylibacter sp.]|uniref:polysaccharide deacetylase family protein n=1 Tax=Phaeodactylibacter sp. TaxID=1940289 RepID=UPI0025D527E9|nr:polysaccharide deacetylase family protein [Phaeodactylibacter sp.]MCI4646705.1 polysaccharide deacetylase family protein [Phaeodactylibacter sp.]MCI5089470.1 polysaccharide deacetylase family protein [Phaeodactylibacter sp.]
MSIFNCRTLWNILPVAALWIGLSFLLVPVQAQPTALTRGDTTKPQMALIFTGHEYADGGDHIRQVLREQEVPGSFFCTGVFYERFTSLVQQLKTEGHYLGAHSDQHLLYAPWSKRDSLLVTRDSFLHDLNANYAKMEKLGIARPEAPWFLPPYEWYNDSIVQWTADAGLQLINITYGTLSHADYTTPEMPNYRSSAQIFQSILDYEEVQSNGLNGFLLLLHIGTDPARTDKFYLHLEALIGELRELGYRFVTLQELFQND